MKVVRVIARLNVGGPSVHVSLVDAEMSKLGHETLLIAGEIDPGEGDMSYLLEELGVPSVRVATLGRSLSPSRDTRAMRDILAVIRRERPDVVHTHTAKAGMLGRTAAKIAGVPCVVHTFHGNVLDGYFSPAKTALFRNLERALAMFTDRIVTISPSQLRDITERHKIAPKSKCSVVRLGFDLAPLLAVERASTQRTADFRGGWVGRLTAIKDPLLLVRIAAQIPNVCFEMIGDGEMRPVVEQAISTAGMHNVRIKGWHKKMDQVYRDLDFVVLTSLNEGTPVALIEAMASGLPFIASDVGGIADLMVGEATQGEGFEIYHNGILVSGRSEAAFASAVSWLHSHPERRREMGQVGRDFAEKTYGKDRLICELEQIYKSVLSAKGLSQVSQASCAR